MLTASQKVKLLDFGVAKRFTIAGSNDTTESLTSMKASFSGTPAYMAPEIMTQKPYDGRADIFSLGLVFYELLTGKQPFVAETFAATLGLVLGFDPVPVKELNHNLPSSVSVVVGKMMMKDPAGRYPNVQAVVTDLRILQRGDTFQLDTSSPKRNRSK